MTKIQTAVVAVAVLIVAWIALQAPRNPPSELSPRRDIGTTQTGSPQTSATTDAAASARRGATVARNQGDASADADAGNTTGDSAATGSATTVGTVAGSVQAAVRPPRPQERRAAPLPIDSDPARQRLAEPLSDTQRLLGAAARVLPVTPEPAPPPPLPEVPAIDVFYDSGEDAQFRSDDQVEVDRPGRIQGDTGTIAFDLKPQWDESVGYADFVSLGDSAKVTKLGNLLQFEIIDAGDVRHVVTTKVDQWEPGSSQQIAATWDDKQLSLYVNGTLVSTDAIEHPIQIAADATLRIGSSYGDGRPIAPATISRIRLRDDVFVPAFSGAATP